MMRPGILTYHDIVDRPSGYRYDVTEAALRAHFQMVASLAVSREWRGEYPLVTFDDGYVSNFEKALPLLTQHSLHAAFFITAGFVEVHSSIMSWSQLRDLAAAGHAIHSHGWSHKLMTRCSDAELRDELERSKKLVEDKLGDTVDAISLPGGRWDDRVLKACAEAGYQHVFHSDPWSSLQTRNGLCVRGRFMVLHSTGIEEVKAMIEGRSVRLLRARLRFMTVKTLKASLGDILYSRLWSWRGGRQGATRR